MNKEITLDDVLEFIRTKGATCDDKIQEVLDSIKGLNMTPKELTDKDYELYKELSKL